MEEERQEREEALLCRSCILLELYSFALGSAGKRRVYTSQPVLDAQEEACRKSLAVASKGKAPLMVQLSARDAIL